MAPNNLQGLNIIHPVQPHPVDSHDLLAGQSYPDLSAQLDLWTNLTFECDEPPLANNHNNEDRRHKNKNEDEEEEALTSHGSSSGETAIHDGHVNVVTATNLGSNLHNPLLPPSPQFDLNAFLASFNVDPYAATSPAVPIHSGITPSLAQLIALHNAPGAPVLTHPGPSQPSNVTNNASIPSPPSTTTQRRSTDDSLSSSTAKRARTRKSSEPTTSPSAISADSPDEFRDEGASSGQSVSAAEDKRRRNTAASARFRLKKKEREAALEGKAKELEHRVNELERECEGLRRENGWLKGLVVGVTGVAQQGPATSSVGSVGTGLKRGRDEE